MGVVKVWRCVELLHCNGTVTCWCQCEGICDGTLDCELVFTILFFFFINYFFYSHSSLGSFVSLKLN